MNVSLKRQLQRSLISSRSHNLLSFLNVNPLAPSRMMFAKSDEDYDIRKIWPSF